MNFGVHLEEEFVALNKIKKNKRDQFLYIVETRIDTQINKIKQCGGRKEKRRRKNK
jgi:hypothetical protein